MTEERTMKVWYFTFGLGHPLKKHAQPVHAQDAEAARLKMLAVYGDKWDGQYDGERFAALDKKYGPYQFLPAMDVTEWEAASLADRILGGGR